MEILALLNPRTKDLQSIPAGFEQLNSQDIAHAIGFINAMGPRLLARYKYANHSIFGVPLKDCLLKIMQKQAQRRKWRKSALLDTVCFLAIKMYCHPKRCENCRGIGQRVWGSRLIICPKCQGSTWHSVKNTEVAEVLGIDADTYEKHWKAKLGIATTTLQDWDRECCKEIKKALRMY